MRRLSMLLFSVSVAGGFLFLARSLESTPTSIPDYTKFEAPHVHPVALSPDGSRLFVVNTPDMRLSVFSLASGTPVLETEISVVRSNSMVPDPRLV